MPKPTKSSASSATRKKHARKAAEGESGPSTDQKTRTKKDKKAPKVKQYIPPPKFTPQRPDPLDLPENIDLVKNLPVDIVVLLRNLGKKSVRTREKALQGLTELADIDDIKPIWDSHFPSLILHSSKRIRLLTATINARFAAQVSPSWLLAAHDIDPQVSSIALSSLGRASSEEMDHDSTLFIRNAILEPDVIYDESQVKSDEVTEEEGDRRARIRVSALGALGWVIQNTKYDSESVTELVSTLWETLSDHPPNVRKAAWGLVNALLRAPDKSTLAAIGPLVLVGAFHELDAGVQSIMWRPLLGVLSAQPNAWLPSDEEDGHGYDDSPYTAFITFLSTSCNASPQLGYPAIVVLLSTLPSSLMLSNGGLTPIFDAFWKPYSLPTEERRTILRSEQMKNDTAFLSSLLESLIFLTRRALKDPSLSSLSSIQGLHQLVKTQLENAWNALLPDPRTGFLEIEKPKVGELVNKFLANLDESLTNDTWEVMRHLILGCLPDVKKARTLVPPFLTAFLCSPSSQVKDSSKMLLNEVLEYALITLESESLSQQSELGLLTDLIPLSAQGTYENENLKRAFERHAKGLIHVHPDLLFAYLETQLSSSSSLKEGRRIWSEVLASLPPTIGDETDETEKALSKLISFADAHPHLNLPLSSSGVDELVFTISQHPISSPMRSEILKGVLRSPKAFLTSEGFRDVVDLLGKVFVEAVAQALTTQDGTGEVGRGMEDVLCSVLEGLVGTTESSIPGGDPREISTKPKSQDEEGEDEENWRIRDLLITSLPSIFISAYLLTPSSSFSPSKKIWEKWVAEEDKLNPSRPKRSLSKIESLDSGKEGKQKPKSKQDEEWEEQIAQIEWNVLEKGWVYPRVERMLRESVVDPKCAFSIEQILDAVKALERTTQTKIDLCTTILPSRTTLDRLLVTMRMGLRPAFAAETGTTSFLFCRPKTESASPPPSSIRNVEYDAQGYALYARCVLGILGVCTNDRIQAKKNVQTLKHFLVIQLVVSDILSTDLTSNHPLFSDEVLGNRPLLSGIVDRVKTISSYLLTTYVPSQGFDWRIKVLESIKEDTSVHHFDTQSLLLVDTIQDVLTLEEETTQPEYEHWVLIQILEGFFQNIPEGKAGRDESQKWLEFGVHFIEENELAGLVVLFCISQYAPEPAAEGIEKLRARYLSDLLGIPKRDGMRTQRGVRALRRLLGVAPRVEGEGVFLSEQRGVNVVRAVQGWISGDDDADEEEDVGAEEEVESLITEIFIHLAPIIQNVPGRHWEFVFDVLENNLESADFAPKDEDPYALVTLTRTLRLVIVIQDLVSTNKALRAEWEKRRIGVLTYIRELAAVRSDPSHMSTFHSTCRQLILEIVQDLPNELVDRETLPKMCHLLTDPSVDVQKMAFQLLRQAAKKRTEYLVIEAGVDVDDSFKAELPRELLLLIGQNVDPEQETHVFGHLLGWMLLFDSFVDASLKVRLSYLDQLRSLDLIPNVFMPNILLILGLDKGITKAFRLDPWAVDEYFVQFYEPKTTFSIQTFASHIYFRALLTLSSLIHSWLQECKDRQVSTAITIYTSTHFSPIIIRNELLSIKAPEVLASLENENLKIKVSSSVNEVVALYLVDEHQLEIKFKIPSEWPLRRIEIRDVQRVGVDENRWRGWIFGVQQTIWAQNGRIVDGLELLKKNVTLHFEGQVECAICYSIISVMDGSLPKKPCKTCKNRFHAGCLFKWFNTSHSSSCPLCRSDII